MDVVAAVDWESGHLSPEDILDELVIRRGENKPRRKAIFRHGSVADGCERWKKQPRRACACALARLCPRSAYISSSS
jgi:hypothetical protein